LGQNSGLSRKRQKTLTEENEANKDWRFFFVPFACSRFIGVAFCSTPCQRAFIRSIFPCRTGLSGSAGTGAEAQRIFMPEPDTRKIHLTGAAKQAWKPDKFKP
jgi:hypothetical protein